MIIWGWRTTVRHLATVVYMCSRTGQSASYQVLKQITKFTLFWIPLFPIGVKYTLECTACGETRKVSKEEAMNMVAAEQQGGQSGYQPPAPSQQGYAQPQPSQGYPQQQAQPGYAPQQPGYAPPQQGYPPQQQGQYPSNGYPQR